MIALLEGIFFAALIAAPIVVMAVRRHNNALEIEDDYRPAYQRTEWGACRCCHDTWRYSEPHMTYLGSAMFGYFPLCEDCWQDLAVPEARLPYYQEIWEEYGGAMPISQWDQLEATVRDGG